MGLSHALWNSRYWLAGLHVLFLAALAAAFVIMVLASYSLELGRPGVLQEIWHTVGTHWYVPFISIAVLWVAAWRLAMQAPEELTRSDSADALGRKDLQNRLESLCIARHLPVPRFYLLDYPAINTLIWGRIDYRLYVTKDACEILSAEQLDAVMAQQLGHLRNGDNHIFPIMDLFITMGGQAVLLPLAALGLILASAPAVLMSLAIVPFGLLAICFSFLWLAFRFYGMWYSRVRRFDADLFAVQLSQNADALVEAIDLAKDRARMPILPEEWRTLAFLDPDPACTPPWYVDPAHRIDDLRKTLGLSMFKAR